MQRTFVLRNDNFAQALWAFLRLNWKPMAEAGKPLAVSVTEAKSKRSLEQNARYWGVVIKAITDQAWVDGKQFSKNAWHEHFARKHIGTERLPNGDLVAISTTTLSVEQFSAYMTTVEAEAISELGVVIE